MTEPIKVSFEATVYSTRIPFRYMVTLTVDDIPTRIYRHVWLKHRATQIMGFMVQHGEDLITQYGVAAELAAEIYAKRRQEAMAKVKVGDSVKLLVDIGPFKKGRVCKVTEVAEPSFYEARGDIEWDDDVYPIRVHPVQSPLDRIALGPKDFIPLRRGEFGPLDTEVDE